MNQFEEYLSALGHWPKSRFYLRADVTRAYFWKLQNGIRAASPELIHRVWKATEGECDLDEVIRYFGDLRNKKVKSEVLRLESDQ